MQANTLQNSKGRPRHSHITYETFHNRVSHYCTLRLGPITSCERIFWSLLLLTAYDYLGAEDHVLHL